MIGRSSREQGLPQSNIYFFDAKNVVNQQMIRALSDQRPCHATETLSVIYNNITKLDANPEWWLEVAEVFEDPSFATAIPSVMFRKYKVFDRLKQ